MNPLLRFMLWAFGYARPVRDVTNDLGLACSADARIGHAGRDEAVRFLRQWGKR